MTDASHTTLPSAPAFLRALATQLQHSDRSVYCPPCLLMSIKVLFQDPDEIAACLQPSCHGFWNAAVATLTARRTEAELAAVRTQLRRNIAECTSKALHSEEHVGAGLDDLLIEALFICLHSCFLPGCKGRRSPFDPSHPKKTFGSKRGLWPLSPNDLIPFGPRQSVEMYVHWCCTLQSSGAAACLAALIFGCRPIVLPYLLESPIRERFVWSLVQMLNMDRARDGSSWPPTVTYTLPDPVPMWFTEPMKHQSLWRAAELVSALTNGPDAHPDDVALIWKGFEAPLLRALNVALELHARNPGAYYVHEEQADALCHWAVRTQRVCPDIPLHIGAQHLKDEMLPKSTQGHLTFLYQRRACWGPGCRAVASDAGRPLQLCAVCKFTQYCSKECQKADWKFAPAPHKGVCPLLRPMVADHQAGSMSWGDVWSLYRFDPEDRDLVVVWLNFAMHTKYHGDIAALVELLASQNASDRLVG